MNLMQFTAFSRLLWPILMIIITLLPFSLSDPRTSEAELKCGVNSSPSNNSYFPVFVKAMEDVSKLVTDDKWGYASSNSTETSVYALAQCYEDLSQTDCLLCYAAARTRIPRCLPSDAARLHLDGCFLRYDSYDFGSESVDQSNDVAVCNNSSGGVNGGGAGFQVNAEELIDNLTRQAVSNGGYAVGGGGSRGVYGLAQCWKTLNTSGCEECLTKASKEVKGCLPRNEGRALNVGCYLRYSTQKFYNDPPQDEGNSGMKTGVIVAIVLGVAGFCMFSVFFAYCGYAKIKKLQQERKNLGQLSALYNKSNLNFKYETLEKATNYFDPSRKIGQGGAGSVYKGTLTNGKIVAVKRLFFNTRQWVDEFFNEVNLVSGIQHKNLVKLLGCSIEGPESLLVYEFVPNKSLDHYLYEKDRVRILNWKERLNIIVGTAEGLAFLHGGSEIRIIHRDIKSSNVILDENFIPKIADFGLARHFAADKTHLSTGIAGTLGYMAPEYLVRGQLTEKADVYSYGVLVLEIVCGRKNIAFVDEAGSLLQTIWKLNTTDKLSEAVDPSLAGNFPPNEAVEVLRIALLCTQAAVTLRPSMAEVVQMLTDKNCPIPVATQPPFINASMLPPGPIRPGSIVLHNTVTRSETSATSTTFSSVQSSDGPQRSK